MLNKHKKIIAKKAEQLLKSFELPDKEFLPVEDY